MKNNRAKKILIVEDEDEMRLALETTLKREGFHLTSVREGQEALGCFEAGKFDLVLTDYKMPKMNGLDLLRAVKKKAPETQVVMMTAYGDIDNAVETMKEGAFDYLLKPFSGDILVSTINRAFINAGETDSPQRRQRAANGKKRDPEREILTANPEMRKLLAFVENIAFSKSTILILGETGTGKELFARYIHQKSPRADKPFMAINCAALPEGLLETEMFGHEKGAFTGAIERKEGKFELTNKGTLLLDEVTEMSLPLQAKLLRVLQEHEIDKVGGKAPVPVDVRVIATTNRDIKRRIKDNQFRQDLYYRLNVIPVNLPTLKERPEDIPLLAENFLRMRCRETGKSISGIDPATLALLQKYRWPGNIRELGNIIERAVLICQGDRLLPAHLFFDEEAETGDVSANPSCATLAGTIYEMERELILQTLEEMRGNKTRAAESLGISIRTLRNKLTDYKNKGPAAPDIN